MPYNAYAVKSDYLLYTALNKHMNTPQAQGPDL